MNYVNRFILVVTYMLGFSRINIAAAKVDAPFSYALHDTLIPTKKQEPQFLLARDNVKLAYYAFIAQEEHAVAVMYHGGGAYSNQGYQWVAEQLQQQGISTYCIDIRGHGRSEGLRGDAPSIEIVLNDIKVVTEWVRLQHENKPLYLIGHSAGAGLLMNYHTVYKDVKIKGYILLAPYLGPLAGTCRYEGDDKQSFVKKVRTWVFILNALSPVSWFWHIDAVYFNYADELLQKDPLYVTKYTYVMSSATTPYAIDTILKNWGDMPLSVYIGQQDEQFIPEKTVALFKKTNQETTYAAIVPEAAHLSLLQKAPELISNCIPPCTRE